MEQNTEKRGPIEKGAKGWPINPFGVVALLVFAAVVVLFIIKPILTKTADQTQIPGNAAGGRIVSPTAGQIIKGDRLSIELSADEQDKVGKVQFWAKTYADGKWQMIGEVSQAPYSLDWQIPDNYQNKAVALTSHIYNKDGKIIKDPGGWREGVILLSE